MSDPIEVKELYELITQVRLDIASMNGKLDKINDMDKKLQELELKELKTSQTVDTLQKRIDKIEDSHTWHWRTTVGATIVGLLNLAFGIVLYFITKGSH